MNIENLKNKIEDYSAEIFFTLLESQTSHKISDEDLKEMHGWIEKLTFIDEEESIDDTNLVHITESILLLINYIMDKKSDYTDEVNDLLIKYLKVLDGLGAKIEANDTGDPLDEEVLKDIGYTTLDENCTLIIKNIEDNIEAERLEAEMLLEEKQSKEENPLVEIILFKLKGVKYGIELNKIQEIIVFPEHITRIPGLKEMTLGVINLRGEVSPLFDLRLWFKTQGKDTIKYTDEDIVIFVKNDEDKIIGLVIDEVVDVISVNTEELLPVAASVDIPEEFLKGLLNYNERDMIVLLDINALLTEDTLETFKLN